MILVIAMAFLILGTISAASATNMTGNWSGSSGVYNATAGPVNVTVNETTSGAATVTATPTGTTNTYSGFWNNVSASAANHSSFETTLNWNTMNNANNGTITFTFSRPVDNPILFIDRIGGASGTTSASALLTLVTPGLTLTKLSGPAHFEVTSTTIQRTPNVTTTATAEASMNSTNGTASGTVQINGYNITSVTFFWKGVGASGASGDGIEFIWQLDAPIDLSINQSASQTTATAGNSLTYTITVTNNGNSTILSTDTFTVIDTLPSGFTVSSFTPSAGSYNNVTGAWTGVTLAEGQSVTLTIVGTVSPSATGSLTNKVNVTVPSGITDPVSTNNNATLTTAIQRIADLSITKTDSPDPVVAGKTLTYVITVVNNGPSTILSSDIFTVIDTLPSGFTVSSFTPSAGSYNNVTGAWTGVTLASGQNVTLTITGTVGSSVTGNLTNIANVTPPTGVTDNNTTNDQTPPVITTVDGLPVANNDNKTTPEDTPISGNLPASDPDGPIALVNFIINGTTYSPGTSVNIPGVGTIKINSDGSYTFTPAANYNGPVPTITYTVKDSTGNNATANLTITVSPVNDAPVAVNDSVVTPEDTPVNIPVLVNDSDVDGDALTVSGVTQPAHGTVVVNANGTVTYTPVADYNGVDSFTYTVSDGKGGSSTANVTVNVTAVNDAPVAVNDSVVTPEDTPVNIPVLVNDSDVDGDNLTIISVTQPHDCTAVINSDGTITYTPDPNFHGNDSFTYTISDGNGGTSTATVYITVTPVNDPPIAVNDSVSVDEDAVLTGNVAINDIPSVDGGNVWSVISNPEHGSVTMNLDGTFTYTPNADYHGSDSFTYQIVNVDGDISNATVYIIVNDIPEAKDDHLSVGKNGTVIGNVAGNDHLNGNNTFSVVSGPKHGSLSLKADGTFVYKPDPGFVGVDTFVYSITDDSGRTSLATVTITVKAPVPENNTTVHAVENQTKVPMQHTGVPLLWAVLAVFMVLTGIISGKRE